MPDVPGASNPVAAAVRDAVQRLPGELAGQGMGSPLDVVTAAQELSAAVINHRDASGRGRLVTARIRGERQYDH
jgi:hypothetical protein